MAQSEQALCLAQNLTIASLNAQVSAMTPRFYLNDDGVICYSRGCYFPDWELHNFQRHVVERHKAISFVVDHEDNFETLELVDVEDAEYALLIVFLPNEQRTSTSIPNDHFQESFEIHLVDANDDVCWDDYTNVATVRRLISDLFGILRKELKTCPRFQQSLDEFQQKLNDYHASE